MARKQKAQLTEEELKAKKLTAETRAALAKCKIGKAEDFEPIVWRVETLSEQRLRDKLQRNHSFETMSSWNDKENKRFGFEIVENSAENGHTTVYISYAEACKEFGWKSFKFEGFQDMTVRPTWLKSSI